MANLQGNEATLTKFKPKWRSGKTQTIRVPIAIADKVLEVARLIDEHKLPYNTDTSDINQNKIIRIAQEAFSTKSNSGGKIKESLANILTELNIPVTKVNRNWLITETNDIN